MADRFFSARSAWESVGATYTNAPPRKASLAWIAQESARTLAGLAGGMPNQVQSPRDSDSAS